MERHQYEELHFSGCEPFVMLRGDQTRTIQTKGNDYINKLETVKFPTKE